MTADSSPPPLAPDSAGAAPAEPKADAQGGEQLVEQPETPEEMRRAGTICIATGVGVGALGAGAAMLGGAVCPFCYLATPLLVGAGIVKHFQARKRSGKGQ